MHILIKPLAVTINSTIQINNTIFAKTLGMFLCEVVYLYKCSINKNNVLAMVELLLWSVWPDLTSSHMQKHAIFTNRLLISYVKQIRSTRPWNVKTHGVICFDCYTLRVHCLPTRNIPNMWSVSSSKTKCKWHLEFFRDKKVAKIVDKLIFLIVNLHSKQEIGSTRNMFIRIWNALVCYGDKTL